MSEQQREPTEAEKRLILARARVDEARDLLAQAEQEKQDAIRAVLAERQQR